MSKNKISCIIRKKVFEYFVAVAPDGEELQIKGIDKDKLIAGKNIIGEIKEEYKQVQYEDGEWSRSYTIEKWLQVRTKS